LLALIENPPIILPRYLLKILPQQLISQKPIYLPRFFKRHILYPSRIKYSIGLQRVRPVYSPGSVGTSWCVLRYCPEDLWNPHHKLFTLSLKSSQFSR